MRARIVIMKEDKNLTKEQRQAKVERKLDDLIKKPSIATKLKRFMTDPIIWPKQENIKG